MKYIGNNKKKIFYKSEVDKSDFWKSRKLFIQLVVFSTKY